MSYIPTPEQAFDIICGAFEKGLSFGIDWLYLDNSWVFPSGYVGTDSITNKYPYLFELVFDWVEFVRDFPYLDLVVGISDWNEMSPNLWDLWNSFFGIGDVKRDVDSDERDRLMTELSKIEYYKFTEVVSLGIWVHDGKIEFLSPQKFLPIYDRYNEKYPMPFYGDLSRKFWDDKRPAELTRDYIERVLKKCGKDPADKQYAWRIDELLDKRPCEMSEFLNNNNV